ncbi:MAG: hypothetical protein ABR529_00570 [Actinomycetota bacterium]
MSLLGSSMLLARAQRGATVSTKRLSNPRTTAVAAAVAGQVGFRAHSYAGFNAGDEITGQKPESKLWFHDGSWWATLLSPAEGGAHTIHQLQGETWVNTGVVTDTRPTAREDVLSTGSTLYVVSRAQGGGQNMLRRFSYSSGAYQLDAGFPVNVPGSGAETITIARDTTGTLWLTYEANTNIFVASSRGSDTSWGTPFVVPVAGATGVKGDDISTVIAFSDASGPATGVFWSNQNVQKDFFAVHRDGTSEQTWTVETALSGTNEADDHINLKTADDRVFAAVKTSKTDSGSPLIRLLERSSTGTWSKHPVALVSEANTRPITMVEINETSNQIYVFFSIGGAVSPNGIGYKVSSLSNIGFSGAATTFIQGANGEEINNATSMKDNASAASGIVVVASDPSNYWWNRLGGTSTPPPADEAPVAQDGTATTPSGTPVDIGLDATDADTCELTFSIVSQPTQGTLGSITDSTCTPGSPQRRLGHRDVHAQLGRDGDRLVHVQGERRHGGFQHSHDLDHDRR